MTDQTYQGWSNRATWNVTLWLDNEESSYRHIQLMAKNRKNNPESLATQIKLYCETLWPLHKTPDGDKLKDINFLEIAEHVLED